MIEPKRSPVSGEYDWATAACGFGKWYPSLATCAFQRVTYPAGTVFHISDVDTMRGSELNSIICGPNGRFWVAKP
jgi:hypothetical protein